MTKEQWQTNLTKLINHNGGWFVTSVPDHVIPKVGIVITLINPDGDEVKALTLSEATLEEAKKDCTFLGIPLVNPAQRYMKAILD